MGVPKLLGLDGSTPHPSANRKEGGTPTIGASRHQEGWGSPIVKDGGTPCLERERWGYPPSHIRDWDLAGVSSRTDTHTNENITSRRTTYAVGKKKIVIYQFLICCSNFSTGNIPSDPGVSQQGWSHLAMPNSPIFFFFPQFSQ